MISREQVLELAMALPNAGHDCPFTEDFDTTVLRHTDTGKWFGLLMRVDNRKVGLPGDGETEAINLKCDPLLRDVLVQTYRGILPAYHMNKYHWITVLLDSDVPLSELADRIRMSYDLTARKLPRSRRSNG